MSKNSNLVLSMLLAGIAISGCSTPADKVENAIEDGIEANEDYQEEIKIYKETQAGKIAANELVIEDCKATVEHHGADALSNYDKVVADLERRNEELKMKLQEYKADGKENWRIFKNEFNHDMDELGKAFSDLSVNNVK